MPASELSITHGMCDVIFAYEVGLSIDLEACAHRLTAITQRTRIDPKHRTPLLGHTLPTRSLSC
jgi:hypothetical protein